MAKHLLLVGPSGVGKSKLQDTAISSGLDHIVRSISATTRPPRREEKNGVDYFFVENIKFQEMVENEKFLEFKPYSRWLYGTPKAFVEEHLAKGNDVLGIVEVNGARTTETRYTEEGKRHKLVLVYVYPEKFLDLPLHLEERDIKKDFSSEHITAAKERIKERLEIAIAEIEFINECDYRICMRHNHFEEAYKQVESIILAERAREKVSRYKAKFIRDAAEFLKSY